jgi:hypothetical protein
MEQSQTRPIYWVLVALIAVAVVVVALRPGTTETQVLPPLDIPDPADAEPGSGLVISRIRTGGTSIFGIEFGSFDHQLEVQLYAPPGCIETIRFGDHWPPGTPECATETVIEGEFVSGGTASTGESIIGVLVDVSADCYDATARGAAWPLTAPECTADSG